MARSDLGLNTEDEEEEQEPPRVLFWYPKEYVLQTWRQNQKHGTFPGGGAYNDLDPQLEADWQRITARYNWHYDQLRPRDDGNGNRTSKRASDIWHELSNESETAQDWQATLGD
jgi:hypothetical protein